MRIGRTIDGRYTPCRAKPENVGRGRCNHVEHREVTPRQWTDIRERQLAAEYGNADEPTGLGSTGTPVVASVATRVEDARRHWGEDSIVPYDMELPGEAVELIDALTVGEPLVVGGVVRDSLVGRPNKDVDIEVYGAGLDDLQHVLRANGVHVDAVGRQFGVLTASSPDWSMTIDVSVPRTENRVGVGHRAFEANPDPDLSVHDAAGRRDFTFNAIMYDPRRHVLIDPYHGADDLKNHVMRAVGPHFAEDPLRVLRAMQFAGRFNLTMDGDTVRMCRSLRGEYDALSVERVRGEWNKLFSRAVSPAASMRVLRETGWDTTIPGLHEAMDGPDAAAVLDRAWSGDHDPTMRRAALAGLLPSDALGPYLHATCMSDNQRRRVRALATARPSDFGGAPGLREWSWRHRGDTIGLDDIREYADVVDDRELAAAVPSGDWFEEPLIDGSDIIASTSRKPGPWVRRTLDELRHEQYTGGFRDRAHALGRMRELLA